MQNSYSLGCYTYSLIALRPNLNMNTLTTNLKRTIFLLIKQFHSILPKNLSLRSFFITKSLAVKHQPSSSVLFLFTCITTRQAFIAQGGIYYSTLIVGKKATFIPQKGHIFSLHQRGGGGGTSPNTAGICASCFPFII